MPRLDDLLRDVTHDLVAGDPSTRIRDVVDDSRRARERSLFVAVQGLKEDGARYATEAVARGACAVIAEHDPGGVPEGVALALVPDARLALAQLAAARWRHPSHRLGLVGVTGTDGKTTTATLVEQILTAAGNPVGLLTTVELRICGRRLANSTALTTPGAPDVQRALARMVRAGARWAVLECSSHALALDRVADCAFDVAVMTNVTTEHLDFHGTFDRYVEAKLRLFAMLGQSTGSASVSRLGVVNADDPCAERFRDACPARTLSYGFGPDADVRAVDVRLRADGASFAIDGTFGRRRIETRFVGRFNISNWLAAVTVALGQGISWSAIEAAAATADPPAGRLEPVEMGQPFGVWVDFAHTPKALRAALETARTIASGRLIVVFGAAGQRYALNRPEMGAVACQLADLAIVTTDDPYMEDPAALAESVVGGVRASSGPARFLRILDRREAMDAAFGLAEPGDLVVVAGRGHERFQTVGTTRVPFDDVKIARELLRQRFRAAPNVAAAG